jgi:ectoine hydroxylase-related dioxygenase (phytanoyl-CoA dioxygenase family)
MMFQRSFTHISCLACSAHVAPGTLHRLISQYPDERGYYQEEKKMEEVDEVRGKGGTTCFGIASSTTPTEANCSKNGRMPERLSEKVSTEALKPRVGVRVVGYTLRTAIFDLPLFAILFLYAATVWFRHVHDNYLVPQLESLPFGDDRGESTYYHRRCDDASDMTTFNGADLFLPLSATPEEAYDHQLKHGFTIFQGILKPETCENLRNFVISRNHNLKEEETIYVIENDKRYSFGLGTEEPSVTAAMKELATSPRLRPALEAILGPDPALIEMTAITATYGADAQWWHDDVISSASAVQFGRAFGPSYSVFVQLQNTTKAMGATSACPGTHFCSGGAMKEFCDASGFQLVGADGQWGQGDALLMNMNSWHRGAAHTDPNALDRVMLILTFVPKPISRAETRQLSQGITFSLRWDMWGHTLNDLAKADTAMAQPWATLRSLGLYKKQSASWGIDYVTSASMRTANNDNGFKPDDLETFLDRGGFWFLPNWLENFDIDWDNDESWPEYFKGTQRLCESFFEKVVKYSIAGYFAWFLVLSVFRRKPATLKNAVLRCVVVTTLVGSLFHLAKKKCDSSGWASDIRTGRRYGRTSDIERPYFNNRFTLATYPTKTDVLIEIRYGSKQLALYNDFLPVGHPGNRYFRDLIQRVVSVYKGYTIEFQDAAAHNIAENVATNHGRFLHQGPDGYWFWLDSKDTIDYIRQELATASDELTAALAQAARFMESDYKYGIYRRSALSIRHAVPYLRDLKTRLISVNMAQRADPPSSASRHVYSKYTHSLSLADDIRERQFGSTGAVVTSWPPAAANRRFTRKLLPLPHAPAKFARHERTVQATPAVEPPYLGAWLAVGDRVECFEFDFWYYGKLVSVTAFGDYTMEFSDKTLAHFDQYTIRPFSEYCTGERLECYTDAQDDFAPCTIERLMPDGSYLATLDGRKDGKLFRFVKGHFRRSGPQLRTKFVFVDLYHGDGAED